MIKNIFLISIVTIIQGISVMAQVGINNANPSATLDVTGSVVVQKNLFLENPQAFSMIRGSKMLIQKTDDQIVQYDIDISKYGPINYVQFVFRNTHTSGLKDYDTKISPTDYLVTVQGYYFLASGNNSTSVTIKSMTHDDNIEGFQMYAYIHASKKTWHIRGFVNNSNFQHDNGNTPIDLYMNLIIYRNGFIAKPLEDIIVNMNNSETKTARLPSGF